jgi:hypothetical protein
MCDLTFNADEFRDSVNDLVPEFQRSQILSAIELEKDADFDALGTSLTGESSQSGFLFYTGAGTPKASIWAAIKAELYKLLCTSSKNYSSLRAEGSTTVKNLITVAASSIAGSFNVGLGVITGAVTIALMACLKVGTNAWCEVNKPVQVSI